MSMNMPWCTRMSVFHHADPSQGLNLGLTVSDFVTCPTLPSPAPLRQAGSHVVQIGLKGSTSRGWPWNSDPLASNPKCWDYSCAAMLKFMTPNFSSASGLSSELQILLIMSSAFPFDCLKRILIQTFFSHKFLPYNFYQLLHYSTGVNKIPWAEWE